MLTVNFNCVNVLKIQGDKMLTLFAHLNRHDWQVLRGAFVEFARIQEDQNKNQIPAKRVSKIYLEVCMGVP